MKPPALVFLSLLFFCLSQTGANKHRPGSAAARGQNETTAQSRAVGNPCKAVPLDFVFVIDSSRSIRPRDYEKVKTFIVNLVQFLEVGPEATRVGLLQYGSVVQPEFSLSTFSTKAEVEQAVRNMKHLATGTMTGLAIQYAAETSFTEADGARPAHLHIPRIAVVVTDGRPQDRVEEVAAQARQAGIQIFAIGVGRVDMKTLKTIGSEPHSEHVHLVASFSQMETLVSVFQSKLCRGSEMCELLEHQCQHICVSSPASFRCKCREGFTLNPDGKTCKAEDACATADHGCRHFCANLAEGYECRCRPGYRLKPDLRTCSKIDFCDLGDHGCQHDCFSTPESYTCGCRRGYRLNPDGKTCTKRDHCAGGNPGCEQELISTEDACVCRCKPGFTLRPDGRTCQSLDVCQTLEHGCQHQCISAADSYVCRCSEGFVLEEDGKRCKRSACADGVMDLVFVIDGSKSMGPANFERVKQFVISIVESLDVSPTGAHVGLLQYSTNVRTEFTLSQHTSAQGIRQAVSRMQYMGRGSMTGSALRRMFQSSFSAEEGARPNVPRVSVVFTDGRSQDDASEWAKKAKNSGVTIYAVGVGKAIEQELREIASEPEEKHLYYAQEFKDVGEITEKLKSRMCTDKPSDENRCRCENMIIFQNQVTEKLNTLVQSIEAMSTRLQALENTSA